MKRNEEAVHNSSAGETLPRSLATSPSSMANVILAGDLRNTSSRLQEPSIAASMATFSAASFVAAANGNMVSTTHEASPVHFVTSQASKTATPQLAAHQQHIYHQSVAHQQVRHGLTSSADSPPSSSQATAQQQNTMQQAFQQMSAGPHGPGAQQFQRLKVEDALSYLDQVKYKFGNQPQVYNDFLDIMKEFKSQSIDTPGVIARVSSLFRGHPELIVGFNTFLPPGYKIEVQAEQVSVSVPGSMGVPAHIHHITHGPNPVTTTQLDVVARSTPPIQQVSITTVPQLAQAAVPPPVATPPAAAAASAAPAPAAPVKEEVFSTNSAGLTTVKPAVPSPTSSTAAASVSSGPAAPSFGATTTTTTTSTVLTKETSSSPQLGAAAHGYANSAAAVAAFGIPNASQPVEFNHAINYVNKIKNRFQGQPDIYKQFLEILHTYQKEQRILKEGVVPPPNYRPTLTEAEVYDKVAQLFQNQEDLLQEFGQFLPDATNVTRGGSCSGGLIPVTLPAIPASSVPSAASITKKQPLTVAEPVKSPTIPASTITSNETLTTVKPALKRSAPAALASSPSTASAPSMIPNKKPRLNSSSKDHSVAEAGKYGTMTDFAFFDKVRRVACRSREVYDNFLRCLILYHQEIISKVELVQLITPFLNRYPDLLKWFKDFLGLKDTIGVSGFYSNVEAQPYNLIRTRMEREMYATTKDGKDSHDGAEMQAMEIDYSTCKRLGTSYCALPKSYEPPKCSGRTPLCKEVLNETWVSFPTWSSEDSTFVSSRKTQYEEYIYRTEDERYELDIVLETHMSTIRVLEGVMKKLNHRMNPEEATRFKLDDCLGGSSPTIHIRAIRRIYGDKASEIIEGLKRSPLVAIPVVLRRMKAKEEEWREAQKGFNKIWREQNEKYYLKSLDHLGTNFKQNDVKALRSKALINEIETIFEERNEENSSGGKNQMSSSGGGPHLKLPYKSRHKILDDAADLLIHHAKRQTGITKEDKRRIKTLLRHTTPDIFRHPRQEMSEDERENDDDDDMDDPDDMDERQLKKDKRKSGAGGKLTNGGRMSAASRIAACGVDDYTLFLANSHWFVFLRLHHILCERLTKIYDRAAVLFDEEKDEATKQRLRSGNGRKDNDSVAVALRLKPKPEVDVDQYYTHFLSMVKNLLDGNIEAMHFEDSLREMFGIHAYLAFTLDKVIANAVRQLAHLVTDATCLQCTEIFLEENGLKIGTKGAVAAAAAAAAASDDAVADEAKRTQGELSYQRRMEQLLADENLFRVVLWHQETETTLAIEMLDMDSHSSCSGGDNPPLQDVRNWASYVEGFVSSSSSSRIDPAVTEKARRKNTDPSVAFHSTVKKPVFLQRNLKQWERRRRKDTPNPSRDEKTAADNDDDEPMKDVAEVREDSHCVFNVNSYQMVFVANNESFLYKRHAFTRAKQCHRAVTLRMRKQFVAWRDKWAAQNVSPDAEKATTNWLVGKGDHLDFKPQLRTVRIVKNVEHKAPFGPLIKYHVEYDKS